MVMCECELQRLEGAVGSLGTGVTGGWETHN